MSLSHAKKKKIQKFLANDFILEKSGKILLFQNWLELKLNYMAICDGHDATKWNFEPTVITSVFQNKRNKKAVSLTQCTITQYTLASYVFGCDETKQHLCWKTISINAIETETEMVRTKEWIT